MISDVLFVALGTLSETSETLYVMSETLFVTSEVLLWVMCVGDTVVEDIFGKIFFGKIFLENRGGFLNGFLLGTLVP